jgi:flagellar biogenesis protein FliO
MAGYVTSLLLLAAVVAAAAVLAWRRRHAVVAGRGSASLRAIEFAPLGPRDRLVLAECEGRRYLLAQGPQGVTLLDRLFENGTPLAAGEGGVAR